MARFVVITIVIKLKNLSNKLHRKWKKKELVRQKQSESLS